VNLFGKGDVTGGGEFKSQDYVNTASAGISAEIPFERRGRREAVKLAALKLDASRRAWQQKQDEVALEVASSYSQLRSLANSVEIQTKNKEIAEKRAENASFRFKEGELSNREIVEAQTELLNARNGYVAALLSYEVQRLKLLRNIGLLDVGPDGDVIELKP
jgi:outer membrane protein TolC